MKTHVKLFLVSDTFYYPAKFQQFYGPAKLQDTFYCLATDFFSSKAVVLFPGNFEHITQRPDKFF